MSAMTEEQKEQLRARLFELADICPFDECNPDDCPLYRLRSLPAKERLAWWRALPEDDLIYLAAYHYVCYGMKLRAGPGDSRPQL
jgi:hypothetical protein